MPLLDGEIREVLLTNTALIVTRLSCCQEISFLGKLLAKRVTHLESGVPTGTILERHSRGVTLKMQLNLLTSMGLLVSERDLGSNV